VRSKIVIAVEDGRVLTMSAAEVWPFINDEAPTIAERLR
jgi:hypothetical protein